jgi:transcriptional regulator with XRE-family HTH domain
MATVPDLGPDLRGPDPSDPGRHGVGPVIGAGHPDPGPRGTNTRSPRQRATREVLAGRRRAAYVAARLGVGLKDARVRSGRTQQECAATARLSQARWSNLERGLGASAPLATWAIAAAAAGQELVGFLDQAPGADLPRDIEHLRRQSAIAERASVGGWAVAPEMPVVVGTAGRVIDALLTRATSREAAVFEVWDLFLDVGQALRSFDEKVAAVRLNLPGWTVSGAWVIRGTRRNRSLVAEIAPLFRARFPAAGSAWLRALDSRAGAMPREPALLWTDAVGAHLSAARRAA